MTTPSEVLPWQPGDVILSADRSLYIRVCDDNSGGGRWPWHDGVDCVPTDGYPTPEGGTADYLVQRPVTLLIRDGKPLGGVTIDDQRITP